MKKLFLLFSVVLIAIPAFTQTNHSGNISADETWLAAGNPHFITNSITVVDGVTLTLEEGVEVYVNPNKAITVRGTLVADGTSADPILITSSQLFPAPGDWSYIYLNDADPGTILDYVEVNYGGGVFGSVFIRNSTDNVQISNCLIKNSEGYGIRLANSSSNPSISNCSFENNGDYPIYTHANRVGDITGTNVFTGNNPDAIRVQQGTVTTSTWLDQGVPYVLFGNVTVDDLETLTIDEGVQILFEGTRRIQVNGGLVANGTAGNWITFSSNAAIPAKGDWDRIYFNQAEPSSLSYCLVEFAGSGTSSIDVRNSGPNVSIENVVVDNSAAYGIFNRGTSNTAISNSTIQNCNSYPIYTVGNNIKDITGTMILTGNIPDAIYATQDNMTTGTWLNHSVPYILGGNMTVDDGQTLTVNAGNILKFDGNYRFQVNGGIVTNGDAVNPITFTSNAATPASGDWDRLYLNSVDFPCSLNYCNFSFGGSSGNGTVDARNSGTDVTVTNCSIDNSQSYGIFMNNSTFVSISDCSVTNCGDFPIYTNADAVKLITGSMTFGGNSPDEILVRNGSITTGTWLNHAVPYNLSGGNFIVADGEVLTINPGIVMKIEANRRFEIQGTLLANGTSGEHIVFTSNADTPAAGDWDRVYFNDPDAPCTFNYCEVNYAGSSSNGAIDAQNSGSNVAITNTMIDQSSSYGIEMNINSAVAISDCSIGNCNNYPIRTFGDNVKLITGTMTFTNNAPDAILVRPQNILSGIWLNHGVPYVIDNDIDQIDGNILILNAGIQLKFNSGARLRVFGTLVANGTDSEHIVFTSNQDVPAPGDWEQLIFDGADSGTELHYLDVMYGGDFNANINIINSGSNVKFFNSTISNSAEYGVRITGNSNPTFINSTITDNVSDGVRIQGNASATFGEDESEWNDIFNNGGYQLSNGFVDIEARYIYWGATACGSIGDLIYDKEDNAGLGIVEYDPFLDAGHMVPDLATTWTGSVSTSWTDDGNWDNGAPCGSSNVTIPGGPINQPIVSSDESCYDMTIEPGGQLTVTSGFTLSVRGNLVLEADASGAASVVEDFGLFVTGNTESEVYIEADRWHFVSPTMTDQTAGVFLQMYLYGHEESSNTFVNIVDETTPLGVGKGYEVWSYSSPSPPNPGTTTRAYTGGTLNSGSYFLPVTNTGSGWNFLGNPYPSAIDWDNPSWIKSGIDGTVWVWNGTQYLSWNGVTGDLTDGIIPAGQAFFVKASGASPILAVGNATRQHGVSLYKDGEVKDLLKLAIQGNGLKDNIFFNFNENATMGYDTLFDSYKLMGLEEAPQVYSYIGDEKIKINTMKEIGAYKIVPMALEVGAETEYTMSASGLHSFEENVLIYLEDTKEDVMIDLNVQSDYTFTASPEDDPDRFNVHFLKSTVDIVDPELSMLQIYSSGNSVFVKNLDENLEDATITVFNISGQNVYENLLQDIPVNRFELNLQSGYYVVKVLSGTAVNSQKVFIQ